MVVFLRPISSVYWLLSCEAEMNFIMKCSSREIIYLHSFITLSIFAKFQRRHPKLVMNNLHTYFFCLLLTVCWRIQGGPIKSKPLINYH